MGDKETDDWYFFMTYIKQIWFANGIHHHYGMEKFTPKFGKEFFDGLLNETGAIISDEAKNIIFNRKLAQFWYF